MPELQNRPAIQLPVTRIQKFCTQDGPGVRTTVFLKGCPLRCCWCHNPETQRMRSETLFAPRLCIECGACAQVCEAGAHAIRDNGHVRVYEQCIGCGACAQVCPSGACEAAQQIMTTAQIMNEVLRDRPFYGKKGGLTLSGGEPMMHPEGCEALLVQAKRAGIHTAMETCGFFDGEWLDRMAPLTDLFLWDFKDSDPARHKAYTGQSNEKILENLRRLDEYDTSIRLRCILVNGVNLNEAHLSAITQMYRSLRHCEGVDLLPYHAYGSSKAVQLGREDPAHREWISSGAQMEWARQYLIDRSVAVG